MNLIVTNNIGEYVESCVSLDCGQGVTAKKKKKEKKKEKKTRHKAAHPNKVLEIKSFIYLEIYKDIFFTISL